jgi:Uma2 family endonuclease
MALDSRIIGLPTESVRGESRQHNLLIGNVYTSLRARLRQRGCEIYFSDMRVKAFNTELFLYPDTLLNPKVIAEVVSKNTESYDRGTKFLHYRALPSLAEYLVVSQNRVHVEHYVRQSESWLLTETSRREDVIELPSVGARLALADVYDRVL